MPLKKDELFDNLKQVEDSCNQRNERLRNAFRQTGEFTTIVLCLFGALTDLGILDYTATVQVITV